MASHLILHLIQSKANFILSRYEPSSSTLSSPINLIRVFLLRLTFLQLPSFHVQQAISFQPPFHDHHSQFLTSPCHEGSRKLLLAPIQRLGNSHSPPRRSTNTTRNPKAQAPRPELVGPAPAVPTNPRWNPGRCYRCLSRHHLIPFFNFLQFISSQESSAGCWLDCFCYCPRLGFVISGMWNGNG